MSNLFQRARRSRDAQPGGGLWPLLPFDQLPSWFGQFGYQGLEYGPGIIQTLQQSRETIQSDFQGYISGAYKTNGAVFACVLARMLIFSEARFQFRTMNRGRPGKLFGTQDLLLLEVPWPNGTTGDLLARIETDISLAGNFYATKVPDRNTPSGVRIARLRPDWVTIILGSMEDAQVSQFDPSSELVGYVYQPGGPGSGSKPRFFAPSEIAHVAPVPDPAARYRGMSWIQPILNEVLGDRLMTQHKINYFTNGASPSLVISMDTGKMDRKTFKEWVDLFESEHTGAANAYRSLYLGHGASATVVGSNLKDLDYAIVQSHGEARIASAAGLPPIVVGFQAGLDAATFSNYAAARRACADQLFRPLWRNTAGSLASIINVPPGAQLWYDDRDISFLQTDAADAADIQLTKATAIRLLVDSGYEPDSVIEAVESDDFTLLNHSGLYSVQLQAPSTSLAPAINEGWQPNDQNVNGNANGSGNGPNPPQVGGTPGQGQLPSPGKRATMLGNVGNVQHLAQALLAAKAGKGSDK